MPLPRIPDLSLPSFQELDESIEANRRNQPSSHLSDNTNDGKDSISSSSAQNINILPNLYPPYPANGWLLPPDPSQNAFREPGFNNQNQGSTKVLQPNVNASRGREERTTPYISGQKCRLQGHPTEITPTPQLRPPLNETQASPIPTQSTPSSAQTTLTLRGPPSPIIPVSATQEETSPSQTQEILANRQRPIEQTRRQRVNRDAAANHRARRRRVGVHFSEVAAHTAKCDVCNKRNKNGMARCQNCGWQICRKCLTDRNGDRTHASFGATHVPEGGRYMPISLPSIDGSQDRSSESIAQVRAAQTLLDLGSFGNGTGTSSTSGDVRSKASGRNMASARGPGLQQKADALSTDSDMTLSVVGDQVWPQDEPDVPIGEDGLPIGYIIIRRNPARAARPSTKMAD
ncbi:Nucleic acid-binding OB-fold [Penicillium cf. griseofulvum]|uniref:Nucleic acid-binding OB-fold n=1 Tax=Penicillium cf. griseofulvum TaxID=2972120 RepID=A0A9W9M6W3_9EURO|nr:Nucleic acid-binding OB-fold [Penicillium cf. griseofulvum]